MVGRGKGVMPPPAKAMAVRGDRKGEPPPNRCGPPYDGEKEEGDPNGYGEDGGEEKRGRGDEAREGSQERHDADAEDAAMEGPRHTQAVTAVRKSWYT